MYCCSGKKRELAMSCSPANVDAATRDYAAFTAHMDDKMVHKICQQGLDVTMLNNNFVGQYFILFPIN